MSPTQKEQRPHEDVPENGDIILLCDDDGELTNMVAYVVRTVSQDSVDGKLVWEVVDDRHVSRYISSHDDFSWREVILA